MDPPPSCVSSLRISFRGRAKTSYEALERRRLLFSRVRSSSDMPPHTPYGSRWASAYSRHSSSTGHDWQIRLARSIRRLRGPPRSPSGWKKNSGSIVLHDPRTCQSQKSTSAPCTSLMRATTITSSPCPRGRFTKSAISVEGIRPETHIEVIGESPLLE